MQPMDPNRSKQNPMDKVDTNWPNGFNVPKCIQMAQWSSCSPAGLMERDGSKWIQILKYSNGPNELNGPNGLDSPNPLTLGRRVQTLGGLPPTWPPALDQSARHWTGNQGFCIKAIEPNHLSGCRRSKTLQSKMQLLSK